MEAPKESRAPKTADVVTEANTEEKNSDPVSFDGMSRDEILTFIKVCENPGQLKPLEFHPLKTVQDAAKKRIEQLQNNA